MSNAELARWVHKLSKRVEQLEAREACRVCQGKGTVWNAHELEDMTCSRCNGSGRLKNDNR